MGRSTCVVHSRLRRADGPHGNVLLLGYQGDVGQALLNVLADTDIGCDIVGRIDTLSLLDERPSEEPSVSTRVRVLEPRRIASGTELTALLTELRADQLLDLSDLDPLVSIRACAQLGVDCVLARSREERPAGAPHAAEIGFAAAATAYAAVAGWMQLGRIAGLLFVDELDAGPHLRNAEPAAERLRAAERALLLE